MVAEGTLRASADGTSVVLPRIPFPVSLAERIRREGIKLAILIVVTVGVFVFTRSVAEYSHAANLRDAVAWYARGQRALSESRVTEAIDGLRRAVLKDPASREYRLTLGVALARAGQPSEAEHVLLLLRDAGPQDAAVNLQLARLAVARHEPAAAVQYYRNALYAPAPTTIDPQRVRLELIEFLLSQGDHDQAMSELLAARANLGTVAADHVAVGGLFVRSGDDRLALNEFRRALEIDPQAIDASESAAAAAFRLGDYRGCLATWRQFLRRPPPAPRCGNWRPRHHTRSARAAARARGTTSTRS